MHPKDSEVYPVDSVVRIKKTGEFAKIMGHNWQKDGKGFLNYYGDIDGRRPGRWALYHDDIELEALPLEDGEDNRPTE